VNLICFLAALAALALRHASNFGVLSPQVHPSVGCNLPLAQAMAKSDRACDGDIATPVSTAWDL
jgi:hypothetical protein